jgi:diguanylate cyclase (GGDEF)-like protein/PAS domain S-box-containing protein
MKMEFELYKNLLENLYDGVYFVDTERRITYWNKGAEQISGFTSSEVVGTRCADNLLMHVDDQGNMLCKESCPLVKTIADGIPQRAEAYLHHKDGHRIPVLIKVTPVQDVQGNIVGAVEIFSDNSSHIAALQKIRDLEKIIYLDPLTELANRRFTEINLRAQFDEMWRYGWQFGIVLIDIDHFKNVNDLYGHEIGDRALKMVAQTLLKNLRSFDVIGRWGGEEFLAIIMNVRKDPLRSIANRFRVLVEQSSFSVGNDIVQVTISLGTTLARSDDTTADLLKRVETLMYQSKSGGRNRVSTD